MKDKIEELIKYYKNKAKYAKNNYENNKETEDISFGILITCVHIIGQLKQLLKAFDSMDVTEDTPDIP